MLPGILSHNGFIVLVSNSGVCAIVYREWETTRRRWPERHDEDDDYDDDYDDDRDDHDDSNDHDDNNDHGDDQQKERARPA